MVLGQNYNYNRYNDLIKIETVTNSTSVTANNWAWISTAAPTTPTGYKKLFSIINSAKGSTDTSQIACGVGLVGCRVISGITQTVTIYCLYFYILNSK